MKIEDIEYDLPDKIVDKKDFDLEQWRKDNPMDYLKAIFLLKQATSSVERNMLFMEIIKIIHLHIPDTLYKYTSLTNNKRLNMKKLDSLREQKVFLSDVKYLNDPFDSKAYFYNPDILMKYERLAIHQGKLIDDFSAYIKVTALTANGVNSMPMWAHYANNHHGYCISYSMNDNTELSSCTFPVQYTNQRIDISSFMDNQAKYLMQEIEKQISMGNKQIPLNDLSLIFIVSLFANLKHSSWSYENEFRCIIGSNAKIAPYMIAKPKEIFIGMRCPSKYEKKLIKIAQQLHVPVYKMAFNELSHDFNLIKQTN